MRESIETDVLIIGAGPAGLSTAIRLAQLCKSSDKNLSITVLEKGAEVGAHILSGAVFDPIALNILFPDWKAKGAPLHTPVNRDAFYYLRQKTQWRLPTPPQMRNSGHYIISLGQLCAWLAEQAEALGVDIFPGFAATECLFEDSGAVCGVITGDMGINKAGEQKPGFTPGIEIKAKHTILAEGARGYLAEQIINHFGLRNNVHQTYGLGIKELWEVDNAAHTPGTVIHTVGAPLAADTYGGGFVYHLKDNRIAVGFVVGLDYENPYLQPYEEFQRFKHHPFIAQQLQNGRALRYGARTLNEGGWQSLPQMEFSGGLIIGCSAGLLDVPRIKGSHMAMQSGIFAAEHLWQQFSESSTEPFSQTIKQSWIGNALYRGRNIRPSFGWGLKRGLLYSALDTYVFSGRAPWTLSHSKADHLCLKPKSYYPIKEYAKPDGILSFDKMTSVNRSNTYHEEDQPAHLKVLAPEKIATTNLCQYGGPETRYCPAGVYEYVTQDGQPQLQINAQNCLHCKACDIKDVEQNLKWTPPEGGGGPNYGDL